ncbi:hypothetical protein BURMUCGD2M_2819 [Burkholderia multivorans CGD2M]|uniref:Uncharacterized protein n=1 Tax=Burkholderia multivorans CGD2 TaxID=513052 RepID=B9BSG6_9BURK|nr:hypothetical protein BURMUCGD2_2732 [Burkholderia multivorans CGD2]EEE11510.1 hypothetical protein BURMUCGD2M_2819 [Burkholderia multivorans CGD2M]
MSDACATQREILTCAQQPPIRRPSIYKQRKFARRPPRARPAHRTVVRRSVAPSPAP